MPDAQPGPRRRVLHYVRTYLRRTETFIYSQIRETHRYEAWMMARDVRNGEIDGFPFEHLHIYARKPIPGPFRLWGNGNYRLIKRMVSEELRFYLSCMRETRPDLVHVHYGPDARYLLPALRVVDLPVVVSFYGYDASSFPNRYLGLGKMYLRAMFDRVQMVLAMSEDMKADLVRIGCPPDRIRIHYPNGVVPQFFSPHRRSVRPGEKTVLLNVAAMEERKGQLELLDAFARVLRHTRDAELHIAGEGPLKGRIERKVRSLALQDHVRLLGHMPYEGLPQALRDAHVFCHPSVTGRTGDKEGIPTIILEASATGLPVAATYHAGIPEAVVDGETGFLVPERDTEGLAEKLLVLIRDPGLRDRMGEAGRRHVLDRFDVATLGRRREALYDTLFED